MIVRPCQPQDLPRVTAAANAVFRAPPRVGDMGREYPLLFDARHADRLWIAEEAPGGALLAHAGYALFDAVVPGRRLRVACFGSVFTDPAHRGRGLATLLLERGAEAARAAGAALALISGSRGLYQRLGFDPLPPVGFHLCPAAAGPVEARPATAADAGDIAALIALQEREPSRFVRAADDWARLLDAGVVFYNPGAVWLFGREGRPVAYAAVEDRASLRAPEVGGDRAALAAALPALAAHLGASAISVIDLPHDRALAAEATARGWPRHEARLPLSARWWDGTPAGSPVPWYGLNYV